jgi:hypothetical protein
MNAIRLHLEDKTIDIIKILSGEIISGVGGVGHCFAWHV